MALPTRPRMSYAALAFSSGPLLGDALVLHRFHLGGLPRKDAAAELRRIDTSSPGAADDEGPLLADFVVKSSPGLSGTTWPLEPILEQAVSTLRLLVASTSPASTCTSGSVAGAFGAVGMFAADKMVADKTAADKAVTDKAAADRASQTRLSPT